MGGGRNGKIPGMANTAWLTAGRNRVCKWGNESLGAVLVHSSGNEVRL